MTDPLAADSVEDPQALVDRYEAGAVRDPDSTDEPGKFWWSLLQAEPESRLRVIARCAEAGWVGPNSVAYLASVLELAEGASWDDVTAAVRALKAASEQEETPEPEPGAGGVANA